MKSKEIDYSVKTFDDLFEKVEINNLNDNIFTLLNQGGLLTSGTKEDYNTMAIGWGGWGIYFSKPTTFLFLRANRYTLEFIKRTKNYTITFFDTVYFDQIMHFGTKSGRDSDKMGTHRLHSVFTPSDMVAYKEAEIIIECELTEITSVNPDDFFVEENKKFIENGYLDAKDYHKIIFGNIVDVWKKKN
jgi:flavin reductase (DIM6/NTAB) family NADH-FMN oxidoreductase RutF